MAARAAPLRVVKKGEAAPRRRRPMSVKQAATSGTHRDLLVALRQRISTEIDNPNTPARDLAALSRRVQEIAKEIAAIDAADEGDEVGEAAATPDEDWPAT